MITVQQLTTINFAATTMIGKGHVLYYTADKLHPSTQAHHLADIESAFQEIAASLGYSVTKIEAETPSSFPLAAE